MQRRVSARIAAGLLVVHGVIEVSALFLADSMSQSMISFGGIDPSRIASSAVPIALLGIMWGCTRFVAAWGLWSGRKWAAGLGIAISLVTLIAAITIIPAGVVDTLLATMALILLLYTWFGDERLEL
ncbi:MAG: hypothetical protein PVI59_01130 [Anaerolineae bacterium]|jgi:drug/metabolite transporter (DMT)-like permease